MNYHVYCDESRPELLYRGPRDGEHYTLIGGLWLPSSARERFKGDVLALREKHHRYEESKWTKISATGVKFYGDLMDLFVDYGNQARFRCIAVDSRKVDLQKYHDGDAELGFYKFYYMLLDAWTFGPDVYDIYCDLKTARVGGRLETLRHCLNRSQSATAPVRRVQAVPSSQSAGLQIVDVLLGAASARLNGALSPGGHKAAVVKRLESRLGIAQIAPTPKAESKYNVFKIWLT